MGKIAQQFSELRKSTPKHIQWILMGAAFVVIVVLIVLLSSNKKTPDIQVIGGDTEDAEPRITFDPADKKLDWEKTKVGESQTSDIEVSANTAIRVTSVKVNMASGDEKTAGISAVETCTNEEIVVSDEASCTITIKYDPVKPMDKTDATVTVTWHPLLDDSQEKTETAANIVLGAFEEKVTQSAPVVEAKPEPKAVVEKNEKAAEEEEEEEDDEEIEEETTAAQDLEKDIEDIAPAIEIIDTTKPEPKPEPAPKKTIEKKISLGTGCSDFAFPAYNLSGVQSGWIKPEGGAYYFYKLSDEDCKTRAGVYNAETGFIMDIANKSKKIGTDAEHIRLSLLSRLPKLANRTSQRTVHKSKQSDDMSSGPQANTGATVAKVELKPRKFVTATYVGSDKANTVVSSMPYDRTFILRQYKPIPATIVSDIQADPNLLKNGIPVRATVDRNVYSDNGRTVILPTGTLMLGYVTGDLPGPYKAVGRMEIKWYQFIRPDGVEFNFTENQHPFSADSQGRKGVPGHGSTDYLQQFVMPMLTAIVPAAVNMIAPIADRFVNQIDLDNNTVVQSGTVRSSELAKNEIIKAWNTVASKLMVDLLDNTTPPFSIAAGTRITVFSPVDLLVTCGDPSDGETTNRKCAIHAYGTTGRQTKTSDADYKDGVQNESAEFIGQVRALMMKSLAEEYCIPEEKSGGVYKANPAKVAESGYDYATLDFYCRSMGTYSAKNNEKQKVVFQAQKDEFKEKYGNNDARQGEFTEEYKKEVLGLEYDDEGKLINPFSQPKQPEEVAEQTATITCEGGVNPDANGCCPGETYTDMGDAGMNCCPDAGGDCFPPIEM